MLPIGPIVELFKDFLLLTITFYVAASVTLALRGHTELTLARVFLVQLQNVFILTKNFFPYLNEIHVYEYLMTIVLKYS